MNKIRTLVATAAFAISGAAFAGNVATPASYLGVLTAFPVQFSGGADPQVPVHYLDFTLGQSSDLVGSIGQVAGQVLFSGVTLVSGDGPEMIPPGATGVPSWRMWSTTFVPAETGYNFQATGLQAGRYRLIFNLGFGGGSALYSGSVYARSAVPEPSAILLLLAGLGVAVAAVARSGRRPA